MKTFILLICILFASCDSDLIPSESYFTNKSAYTVHSFKSTSLCCVIYRIESVGTYEFDDIFEVIDSVGKYQIGDTVYVQIVKNKYDTPLA